MDYTVDPDIARAATLDKAFYRDADAHAIACDRIFARSWQWIGDLGDVEAPASLSPRELLAGTLDEPLLLARDERGTLRCLSNVCTHRGNILVKQACAAAAQIRCGYHSRRFDLAGRMTFMPEFAGAHDFPSPADDLAEVAFASWAGHGFASLAPAAPFDAFVSDAASRLAALPVDRYRHDASRDRTFVVNAHWALYVENYLEGFHIPFVHAALNDVVDYASYASELFRYSNVQIALAKRDEAAFDAAHGEPRVAAWYWWIFPNLMLNVYPWGLSINVVQPLGVERTRVLFRSYVGDRAKLDRGAGGALDRVEAEDEAIVEAVQRGVRSRLYRGGRYSPSRERGVHHFHRLIGEFMASPSSR